MFSPAEDEHVRDDCCLCSSSGDPRPVSWNPEQIGDETGTAALIFAGARKRHAVCSPDLWLGTSLRNFKQEPRRAQPHRLPDVPRSVGIEERCATLAIGPEPKRSRPVIDHHRHRSRPQVPARPSCGKNELERPRRVLDQRSSFAELPEQRACMERVGAPRFGTR